MHIWASIFAAILATSAGADEAAHLKVVRHHHRLHHEDADKSHDGHERAVNQEALTKKQDMFYRMAHMKSTPWDSKPEERKAKCSDMCHLKSFWGFQKGRNCGKQQESLCSLYTSGLASMDLVLTVAECTCNGTDDG